MATISSGVTWRERTPPLNVKYVGKIVGSFSNKTYSFGVTKDICEVQVWWSSSRKKLGYFMEKEGKEISRT